MTSIVQYAKMMRDAQYDIGLKLGVDIAFADSQTRTVLLSNLAIQATLVKILVDKGVLTDVELLTAINGIRSAAYRPDKEPFNPIPWDTTPVTGIPSPPVTGIPSPPVTGV